MPRHGNYLWVKKALTETLDKGKLTTNRNSWMKLYWLKNVLKKQNQTEQGQVIITNDFKPLLNGNSREIYQHNKTVKTNSDKRQHNCCFTIRQGGSTK